jgi:hypothetical protein
MMLYMDGSDANQANGNWQVPFVIEDRFAGLREVVYSLESTGKRKYAELEKRVEM